MYYVALYRLGKLALMASLALTRLSAFEEFFTVTLWISHNEFMNISLHTSLRHVVL
jgi:hypothetical protein